MCSALCKKRQNHRLRARGAPRAARGWRRTVTDSVSDEGAVGTGKSSAGMGVAAGKGSRRYS